MEDKSRDAAAPETKEPGVIIEDVEILDAMEAEMEGEEAQGTAAARKETVDADAEGKEEPDAEATVEDAPKEAEEHAADAEAGAEDAPKEKNYKVDKKVGIALICGAAVVGTLAVLAAYSGRELRRAKAGAKRAIGLTNVDQYDKADRKSIKKLEKKSVRKIDKAKTRTSVRSARDAYEDLLDGFRTRQEKLSDEKLDAVTEAYEDLLKEKNGAKAAAAAVSKIATAAGADTVARVADAAAVGAGADEDFVREYVEDIRGASDAEQLRKLRREYRSGAKKHRSGKF